MRDLGGDLISQTAQEVGWLAYIMGNKTPNANTNPNGTGNIDEYERVKSNFGGSSMSFQLLAPTGQVPVIADSAAAAATRSVSLANPLGATNFFPTFHADGIDLDYISIEAAAGNEARTKDLYQSTLTSEREKMAQTINARLHGNNGTGTITEADQTRASVGSVGYVINASNSYLGVDRSASQNAFFRGIVPTRTTVAYDLKQLAKDINKARFSKARNIVAALANDPWDQVTQVIEAAAGYDATVLKDTTVQYSGDAFIYRGCNFVMDAYASPNWINFCDPRYWEVGLKMTSPTATFVDNPVTKATKIWKYHIWMYQVCRCPGRNLRRQIPNISGTPSWG